MTNPTEEEIQIAAARAEEAYILDGSRCCESCGNSARQDNVRSALKEGFRLGAHFVKSEIITYLKKYREAYGEEFFPTEDLSQFDPNIVTAVSGRMGRFILDNCIRDWEGKK